MLRRGGWTRLRAVSGQGRRVHHYITSRTNIISIIWRFSRCRTRRLRRLAKQPRSMRRFESPVALTPRAAVSKSLLVTPMSSLHYLSESVLSDIIYPYLQ
eukprot:2889298-Pleurochrysis_carterae.AAC.1